MDAIDAALVRFSDNSLELVAYNQFPLNDKIRNEVRSLSADSSNDEISTYHGLLGELFSDAVIKIIQQAKLEGSNILAVGSHGQTIIHLPEADPPQTLQIGDATIIATRTGIKTVADFRRMDLEAGGQGAPLAPALHADLFRSPTVNRCILNLGGIANITVLPADLNRAVTGFDTGPGNGLLDDWNRINNKTNMDENGLWAKSGNPDSDLLKQLLADPYFKKSAPKSSGRDYFNLQWLDRKLNLMNKHLNPADVQATLLQLTVSSIADAIKRQAVAIEELYLCGGGSHNPVLVSRLGDQLPGVAITTTQTLGMNPDAVEAVTFAWLAKRRIEGKPGNLPSVTGASKPVLLGTIFEPRKTRT
ncbi:MAG: Anhydro-N-acetylmuramic acid kinase [Gammaproteobacteria bacterium]|nr:Anhydro-N-acetylmuramic acid kinase [Gammaproteobacteria bacterium]